MSDQLPGEKPAESAHSDAQPQGGSKQRKKRTAKPGTPSSSAKSKNLVGAARYKLGDEIGRGSMGVVYLARDLMADRDVAVKELSFAQGASEERRAEMVERFSREARATSDISSDNVVRVLDTYKNDDRYYLVMEHLEGTTLDALIKKGPLPVEDAIRITTQVLRGLAAAHAAGVVHRDLKPANVFVLPDGSVKVTDFGVAHIEDGETGLTRAGQVLGTLGYMSPEQVGGEPVDGRTDIFATGVMLFEMLVGANPFQADQPTTAMYRIAYEEPPALDPIVPGMPAHLQSVLVKSMAKDPALRYQSADEMIADLENETTPDTSAITKAVAARAKASAKAASAGKKRWVFPHGNLRVAAAVAVAILLVGIAGGSIYVFQKQKDDAARRVAALNSGIAIEARLDEIKALRSRFDAFAVALRAKAATNQAAANKWDSTWSDRLTTYNAQYAAVDAYNAQELQYYNASYTYTSGYYDYWGYYHYGSSSYSYTPQYRKYPAYPKMPAKLKADLTAEQAAIAQLKDEVSALAVKVDDPSLTSAYFPVMGTRLKDLVSSLKDAIDAASAALPTMVTHDPDKGAVIDQTAASVISSSGVESAMAKAQQELDLYLTNYGMARTDLKPGAAGGASGQTP